MQKFGVQALSLSKPHRNRGLKKSVANSEDGWLATLLNGK
jgi:hypothetical protein